MRHSIIGLRFDGVSYSMAEVEYTAKPHLLFVYLYDALFYPARILNDLLENIPIPLFDCLNISLQKIKELHIIDHAVFDRLREAAAHLFFGKCIQKLHVNEHSPGLVKGPEQVFPFRKIDGGLSADAAVYLGHESCGNLDIGNGPHERGRDETRHVTDDSTSQGEESRLSVSAKFYQSLDYGYG